MVHEINMAVEGNSVVAGSTVFHLDLLHRQSFHEAKYTYMLKSTWTKEEYTGS